MRGEHELLMHLNTYPIRDFEICRGNVLLHFVIFRITRLEGRINSVGIKEEGYTRYSVNSLEMDAKQRVSFEEGTNFWNGGLKESQGG